MNDAEFVERLRRHDPAAIQHLTRCFLPSVWRFVFVASQGDRHLAEDIVSETVLAFLQAAAVPDAGFTNPGAWLRSVAQHKLHDHFRAVARVQHLIEQAPSQSNKADNRDPAHEPERQERRAAVRKVMNDLPEAQRLALEWKYLDRLSVREIADRLNITEKAAESILFRARREFRDGLHGLQDDEAPPLNGQSMGRSEAPGVVEQLSEPRP